MSEREPYVAVIFTSRRPVGEHADRDGYAEMAQRMDALARQQPGFLAIDAVRGADGLGVTVSYWASAADAAAWKQVAEHLEAQRLGRDRWYDAYQLVIATVDRQYEWARPTLIHHLALPADWDAARADGVYAISTRGVTLAEEGFIHCSYAHQVGSVADRFYADVDALVLLSIDTQRLGATVVVEPPVEGAREAFPHVYGELPVDAVVTATTVVRRPDGWHFELT